MWPQYIKCKDSLFFPSLSKKRNQHQSSEFRTMSFTVHSSPERILRFQISCSSKQRLITSLCKHRFLAPPLLRATQLLTFPATQIRKCFKSEWRESALVTPTSLNLIGGDIVPSFSPSLKGEIPGIEIVCWSGSRLECVSGLCLLSLSTAWIDIDCNLSVLCLSDCQDANKWGISSQWFCTFYFYHLISRCIIQSAIRANGILDFRSTF